MKIKRQIDKKTVVGYLLAIVFCTIERMLTIIFFQYVNWAQN